MKSFGTLSVALLVASLPAPAAEVILPASQRFAKDTDEVPSFQRHVIPLMGQLGCNGRACHGSFQGQGGFRLSLFGYDFEADHKALVGGDAPRVDLKEPANSLMLRKPTRAVAHKGGRLIHPEDWQYRLFTRWIQGGAPGHREGEAGFTRLEVDPPAVVFTKAGEQARLKVTAVWDDGSREDVTPLSRFRSNDESVALIDESGRVTAEGPGDTAVVAFYDNGVGTVQVLLPVASGSARRTYPDVPTPTKVDELVVARLRQLGIVPADLCTDAEFLRRVSLDLTGSLPTAGEVTAFLADRSADKRGKKVEELLSRPSYAAWWATRLCDWTGNADANGPVGGEQGLRREFARRWYEWVHARVRDNVSYDRIVEGLVMAVGRKPGQSYEDYCTEMGGYFRKDKPADFAARETMPYFWTRRPVGQPGEKALAFAWSFLGVSLQCAQCHKHPYDQWTKQDYDQFTVFFNGVRYGGGNRDQIKAMKEAVGLTGDEDSGAYKREFVKLAETGKLLPFKELTVPFNQKPRKPVKGKGPAGRVLTPKLLGGEEVIAGEYPDPRQPLMDWIRHEDNPYFARAFVNRVWATYFNVGLIDPTDDLNLANPPSNPALLDHLAGGFVKSGYDMKWLHRTIVASRTYQLSHRSNPTNRSDERNYSRAVLRRLPAEVSHDAIVLATAGDEALKRLHGEPEAMRMIGVASCFSSGRDVNNYAVQLFGKPPRAINCDCERSDEPSLLQTVYLRNDLEVRKLLDRPDGWLKQLGRAPKQGVEELIREAFLRTVSRPPEPSELAIARQHVEEAGDTIAGLRDLMWALLNTKEFIVNR